MEKVELLASSPLFEMLSPPELEYVADLARPRQFKTGEVIFEEGSVGDSIFVIAKGEIEILQKRNGGGEQTIAVLGSPAFFGEMSLIDKERRSATARPRSSCDLLQLSVENLAAFRRQYREGFIFLLINIARVLSARLREANLKLSGSPGGSATAIHRNN
jgi:CRP-like cAMP-binding protein